MLTIVVPGVEEPELWDEEKEEFVKREKTKEVTLQLEHSLISVSKWESKWCKSFYSKDEMTNEETIDYIKCMTLNQNVDPDVYLRLTDKNITDILEYIKAPMTATTFYNIDKKTIRGRRITSELIYYWMIALNIPFECQKWHLNRLITLIRVCEEESKPPKSVNKNEVAKSYAAINAERKKLLNTKG